MSAGATVEDIAVFVAQLAKSERGRECLDGLHELIDKRGFCGLTGANARALVHLLIAAKDGKAGTVLDAARDALGAHGYRGF